MADRAAVYVRLSDPRDKSAPSLDSQEQLVREYCETSGYQVVKVFRESFTGFVLRERPEMRDLIALLETGALDVVVVRDVDRFAREQAAIWVFRDICQQHGARLEFALEKFEDTATGKFLLNAKAFAAELEREKIAWRTLTGRRRRLETGKLANAGPDKYGYMRDKESGTRTIVEEEARIVRQLYDWVESGISVNAAWRRVVALGVPPPGRGKVQYRAERPPTNWSPTQVRRILTDETYKGESYGWTWRAPRGQKRSQRPREEWIALPQGVTPPIVTPAQWERVQKKMADAGGAATRNAKRPALLRGLIRCVVCGYAMHCHLEGLTKIRVYRCGSRQRAIGKCDGGKYVRADDCEAWAWEKVAHWVKDEKVAARLAKSSAAKAPTRAATKHAERLAQLYAAQRRWLDLYGDPQSGVPAEEIKTRLADVATHITATKALLDAEAPTEAPIVLPEDVTAFAARWRDRIDSLDFEGKREVLEWLDVRVLGSGKEWRLTSRGGLVTAYHRPPVSRSDT